MSTENTGVGGLSGSPKTMFFLGLASGVGGLSLVALLFILSFLLKGGVPGAWNLKPTDNVVAAAPSAPVAPDAAPPAAPSAPVKPVDEATDHIKGPKNAKVTLIEYSDFECPFCLRHEDTVKQILAKYPNDVRLIYRHYPLTSLHPEAQKAAEASECAGAQGKFWEMHEKIFAANAAGNMNVQQWKTDAKALGLDSAKFDKCLDGGEMAARVNADQNDGTAAGVGGTPATFVNGRMVEGAVPFATFQSILTQEGAAS
jgi:protein-disulfide isomerase